MQSVVSQLNIYPVKSLQGIKVNTVQVRPRGLSLDRRWMLVDEEGTMLTQRTLPILSQIGTHLNDDELSLVLEGEQIQVEPPDEDRIEVRVWHDTVLACRIGGDVSTKLSRFIGQSVKLVWMPDEIQRRVEERPGTQDKVVGFADGFPFLVISEASLEDLNGRLEAAVAMDRFRPNIVVSNTQAFEEDAWKRYEIGGIIFDHVKPCARCVMTTVDPESGRKGKEPLKTLSLFRQRDGEVFFGQNAVHSGTGFLTLGDSVKVLERQGVVI